MTNTFLLAMFLLLHRLTSEHTLCFGVAIEENDGNSPGCSPVKAHFSSLKVPKLPLIHYIAASSTLLFEINSYTLVSFVKHVYIVRILHFFEILFSSDLNISNNQSLSFES